MVLCTIQLNETKKEALRINTQEVSNICTVLQNTAKPTENGLSCRSIGTTIKIADLILHSKNYALRSMSRVLYLSRLEHFTLIFYSQNVQWYVYDIVVLNTMRTYVVRKFSEIHNLSHLFTSKAVSNLNYQRKRYL